MTEATDVRATVTAFVTRLAGRPVDDDEPVVSSRLLESIAVVQLVEFLERTLAITVDDDDLEIGNFDSVSAIVALAQAKRAVR